MQIKYYILLSICLFGTSLASAQSLKAMSYNIRYNNPNDGPNRWEVRKPFLLNQIFYANPAVLGIQEGLADQVDYLNKNLPQYGSIGVGRDDGKKGEQCAIFYQKERYELLESGNFWLSPTPDIPSKGWDASLNRICTYVLLKGKKKERKTKFWVFNTHFDHIGGKAREESAKLIVQKIQELNTQAYPVIIMGDLNTSPGSAPINAINSVFKDTYDISALPPFGPFGTFNGFSWDRPIKNRIDYIFVSKDIQIGQHITMSDAKDQRYPSDHFPILVKLFLE